MKSKLESRGVKGMATLAFPSLGLIVGVLDPHLGAPLLLLVVVGRHFNGFTWTASIAFVLTPRPP